MAIPNSRNFSSSYIELCKQQSLRPLPVICVNLPHSLDLTTDRVKMDDWGPILNSLSLDQSLKSISVRSRYQCRKPLEEINSEDKARAMGKAPVVLSRYLLEWLSHSVAQCVRYSSNLTSLELEGIPFPSDCLAVLCVGLASTKTLTHLSLQRCYIGDSGCELICRTTADIPSIRSLNLGSCDLTNNSGSTIAAALSRQKLSLYHDTWKQSLRYQEPNLETMPGLRRLSLNDNSQLGDDAVANLIESIKDSLWLKALDLQRCGLSDKIGKDLLDLLDHNTTLTVLDVRQNVNLNEEVINEIMKKLQGNNADGKSEYAWLGTTRDDRRTASAGSRRKNENELNDKVSSRPRSALAGHVKRPCPMVATKKVISVAGKSLKGRPPVQPFQDKDPRKTRQTEQRHVLADRNVRSKAKVSVHLDLQSHIRPAMMERQKDVDDQVRDSSVGTSIANESSKNLDSTKSDDTPQIDANAEPEKSGGMKDIEALLIEAREEHEHLLEEKKRNDLLLAEERELRKAAETKLHALKIDLAELENALKEKEKETNGFLLLSQQSLDEICSSFDRLLQLLENRKDSIEAVVVREDIKRRVSSVIRKTKSENLSRGFVVDVGGIEAPPRFIDAEKKFAKSESDMRGTLPPISTLHIERSIGDNPDVGSSTMEERPIPRQEHRKTPLSHSERAREIFSRIVHGDAVLDFSPHNV